MSNVIILLCIALFLVIFTLILNEYESFKQKKKYSTFYNCESTKKVDESIKRMLYVLGNNISSDKKIERMNNIIMDTFEPKYSSIVLFDGTDNVLKVSNVEECYLDAIKNVSEEPIFAEYIAKDTSKYIISKITDIKSYKSALERDIKSVLFSPIYYEDVYLGFWIMEDDKPNSFDNILEEDLKNFKYNLGLFIENAKTQSALEIANVTDKQTGFNNNIYLYTEVPQLQLKNETCSITMIEFKNIEKINEKYGRNIGNTLIIKGCSIIKNISASTSIFIRYSGVRFIVITPGSNAQVAQPIFERVLKELKKCSEFDEDEEVKIETNILLHTLKRQTNVEKEVQKMLNYMEKMKNSNSIRVM